MLPPFFAEVNPFQRHFIVSELTRLTWSSHSCGLAVATALQRAIEEPNAVALLVPSLKAVCNLADGSAANQTMLGKKGTCKGAWLNCDSTHINVRLMSSSYPSFRGLSYLSAYVSLFVFFYFVLMITCVCLSVGSGIGGASVSTCSQL